MKSDAKIWLEIAKAFGTIWKKRTDREKFLTFSGLCHAWFVGMNNDETRRVNLGIFGYHLGWDFYLVGADDADRSHLAILFATMSSDDRADVELYNYRGPTL